MQISNIESITGVQSLRSGTEVFDNFTIVTIPDTQRLAANNATAFNSLIQEIVDQEETKNIQMVLHEGDIVNNGATDAQWDIAYTAMNRLRTNSIPHLFALGNHDYDTDGDARVSNKFNGKFPYTNFNGFDWYGGSYPSTTNDNSYAVQTLGGEKWVFISMECMPRQITRNWADSIIASEAPCRVVLSVHMWLNQYGRRMNLTDDSSNFQPASFTDGETDSWRPDEMWAWTQTHPEMFLINSGHELFINGDTMPPPNANNQNGFSKRTDVVESKTISQVMANYQNMSGNTYGDSAFLRYFEVNPNTKEISVTTHNPVQDYNWTDAENQFTLTY